jgi:hypothetical protein
LIAPQAATRLQPLHSPTDRIAEFHMAALLMPRRSQLQDRQKIRLPSNLPSRSAPQPVAAIRTEAQA